MELLKTKEVCELLKINKQTLFKLMKQGKIPYIKLSDKCIRFPKDEIIAYLRKNTITSETKIEDERRVREIVGRILKRL